MDAAAVPAATRAAPPRRPVARRALAAWLVAAGVAGAFAPGAARAQSSEEPATLSPLPAVLDGTLKAVRERGSLRVGWREASVPFSYRSNLGEPMGYTIALCRQLAADIADALHRELRVQWVPVTSADRLEAVESGRIDLECGSTTNNAERRRRVAFSPTFFVAGTRLMVRKGSPVRDARDLGGRRVVATAGTTNEQAMRKLAERLRPAMHLVAARDHDEALTMLRDGRVDAYAGDDVLLAGFVAQRRLAGEVDIVGELLTYDPYGVMYRKDDALMARLVNDSFQRMARGGEIERQYQQWFMRRLPVGAGVAGVGGGGLGLSMDLPMSPQLETLVEATASRSN